MSDYTNIIQEINTNIPDNTDQSITALKVRTTLIDMLDAVDDNMTEAIGEISVPTKTSDLENDSGFITATSLEPFVTKTELSNASYATETYVVDYVASHSGPIDLSSYVTKEELSQASYVTKSEIATMGYVTSSQLSAMGYITMGDVSACGYITNQDLEQTLSSATYITQNELETKLAGYVSQSDISNMGYVTGSEISSMGYVTQSQLNNASYVNTTQLNEAISSITVPTKTSDLTNDSGFITASDLNNYDFATESYVVDYVAQHAPTPDLSAYVTKTELSNMSYITQSELETKLAGYVTESQLQQAGYVTGSEISYMGYVTQSELNNASYATTSQVNAKQDTLVSGTNIKTINNESVLGSGNITIQGGSEDNSHVLTFTAEQTSTVALKRVGTSTNLANAVLKYSTDGKNWNDYTLGTRITIFTGKSVMFKGTNNTLAVDFSNYHKFEIGYQSNQGKVKVTGDITSLLNKVGGDFSMPAYGCYFLFKNCTNLLTAPDLPSSTLGILCYREMFSGCTSLTTAPKILPATTLADGCYTGMFYNCSSLTTAPELPATTLASVCYSDMFYRCTSLTTAPILPAITLIGQCYNGMFNGCTNLNYIKAMFTTTPSSTYTSNWVNGVASSGTFIKNSAATWDVNDVNGIPEGWTVYKTVAIDTDYIPESYVEDEGKTLQVVNGVWAKVVGGGSTQEQADWNETDSTYASYILNKPDLSNYVTTSELNAMSYATTNDLNTAISGINVPTKTSDLTNDSGFITASSLNGLATETYVTNAIADINMPVIDESLIPNTTLTYTLGDATHLYNNVFANSFNLANNVRVYNENGGIGFQVGNTSAIRIGSNVLYPLSTNSKTLGTSNYQWSYTYSANFIENGTDIKDIYTQTEVVTQAQYDALTTEEKNSETIYVISDQQAYFDNELVTEQSLSTKGFLTADNFQYDSSTGTLTLVL